MRRMLWAGLLALPMLAACADVAKAQGCASCGPFVSPGGRPSGWSAGGNGPFGCGGFCLKLFGSTLQDGPLVNYGPYEGYYPFAPYGPWTSDLRYTGPRSRWPADGACGLCGRHGCNGGCGGGLALGSRLGGWNHQKACGEYAVATFHNVFARVHPCGHCGGSSGGYVSAAPVATEGCSNCGTASAAPVAAPAALPPAQAPVVMPAPVGK